MLQKLMVASLISPLSAARQVFLTPMLTLVLARWCCFASEQKNGFSKQNWKHV